MASESRRSSADRTRSLVSAVANAAVSYGLTPALEARRLHKANLRVPVLGEEGSSLL